MKIIDIIKNKINKKRKGEKSYPKCCDMEIKRQRFDMFVENIGKLHDMLLDTCDPNKQIDEDLLLDTIDDVEIACFELRYFYYNLDRSQKAYDKHNRKIYKMREEEERNGFYVK